MFGSRRVLALPPYIFETMEAEIASLRARGEDIIDLGRSDPDHLSPPAVVAAVQKAAERPETHHYPPYAGILELRRAIVHWYDDRHGVELDPEREVLILAGSKEGLFHLPLAVCDPGDVALIPDPSFPAYRVGAYLAGAEAVPLPLRAERGFLPDLTTVGLDVLRRARLLFLNYPNNPTGAVAPLSFFREAVAFARRYGLVICHDLAYGESGYEGYQAPSLLQADGAKDVAIESITWSKSFCMAGWRLGAVVGNAEVVSVLGRIQMQASSGVFAAIQHAGAVALEEVGPSGFLAANNFTYQSRRDRMIEALGSMGVALRRPWATPYLWLPVPPGVSCTEAARWLLREVGLALVPGVSFGTGGEGHLRLSLTASDRDIDEAANRLEGIGMRRWQEMDRGTGHRSGGGATEVGVLGDKSYLAWQSRAAEEQKASMQRQEDELLGSL